MKKLFYILFCFSLTGCSDPQPQKPANLVRKDKMIQILADLHMVEARVERAILYPDTALMTFNHHEKEVIGKHGVSEEDFRKTYRYYLQDLEALDKLYEVIIDSLSIREIKVSRAVNEEMAAQENENVQPAVAETAVVPDSAKAANTVSTPDTVTATARVVREQEDWMETWVCKLLSFQPYSFTVSPEADNLPYYLSPTIHNLPHSCVLYKVNSNQ